MYELFRAFPGLILFSSVSAFVGIGYIPEAVELLRRNALVIVGMEGFTTDGKKVTALIDYIADFSSIHGDWSARVLASAEAARLIGSQWMSGPQFVEFSVIAS